jgi:hypothetical protein
MFMNTIHKQIETLIELYFSLGASGNAELKCSYIVTP